MAAAFREQVGGGKPIDVAGGLALTHALDPLLSSAKDAAYASD